MAKVGLFSGTVTRTWVVLEGARRHSVVLNHHTVGGSRVVSVNGMEQEGTEGSNTILSGPAELAFKVGGKDAVLRIQAKGSAFLYKLTVDDEELKEENEVVGGSSAGSKAAKYDVHVPSTVLGSDERGDKVAWYLIHTVKTDGDVKREVWTHRRFRDFIGVNEQVRSSFKGSHLLQSLPRPPGRSLKLLNHFTPEFIEDRRSGLEKWLRGLQSIPRAYTNGDLLNLIGVDARTRETSVLVEPGPIGITLHQQGDWVVLADFKPVDGGQGPVQRSGMVAVGDRVSKINGETVLGMTYAAIIDKIKRLPRPIMLHFLGYYPLAPAGDDGDDGEESKGGEVAAAAPVAVVAETTTAVEDEEAPFAGGAGDASESDDAAGEEAPVEPEAAPVEPEAAPVEPEATPAEPEAVVVEPEAAEPTETETPAEPVVATAEDEDATAAEAAAEDGDGDAEEGGDFVGGGGGGDE